MNKLMMRYCPMAEAGEPAGGGDPAKTETPAATQEPAKTETPAATTETPKGEQPKAEPAKTETPAATQEQPKGEQPKAEPGKTETPEPVNLMDDEPEAAEAEAKAEGEGEAKAGQTDEERKAFVDAVKKIDIGEGVQWDDPALEAIAPSLMEITGGDAKKTDGLIKAYTAFQQQKAREFQQANDRFLNGLVDQCRTRFGADLPKVVQLAKAGGLKIFGEKMWNVMKRERAFANNPDIIEKLAAVGRTATDDPGVVKKETATAPARRDWRESMYGGQK